MIDTFADMRNNASKLYYYTEKGGECEGTLQDGEPKAAEPELPSSSSLENVNATVSRLTAASSLGLFDAQTPRTSAAVRGRWTPEYAVIKMALMRQSAAKPKVCFSIKSVKLMLSRDAFQAATQACAATLPELSKVHLNTT